MATAVKKIRFNEDVAQIEATAINLGIQVAKDAGWTPLTVESDSKEVVDLVLHKRSSRTEIAWCIEDIQNKIEGDNMIVIQHIPRECNAMAHAIAKMALECSNDCVWTESFPPQIMNVITQLV